MNYVEQIWAFLLPLSLPYSYAVYTCVTKRLTPVPLAWYYYRNNGPFCLCSEPYSVTYKCACTCTWIIRSIEVNGRVWAPTPGGRSPHHWSSKEELKMADKMVQKNMVLQRRTISTSFNMHQNLRVSNY